MTEEEKHVVNPLQRYFHNSSRSGAKWHTKKKSKGRSATGWDLQVERKNRVLLIEAKYITGPFIFGLAGCTMAPLTKRPEKTKSKKTHSWAAVACWAIGCGWPRSGSKRKNQKHNMRRIYQVLFVYFARNVKF
jgi:hypothetical protein